MSRRTTEITITAEGRDRDKTFVLTEMTARRGEGWGTRALSAMSRAGFEMPDGAEGAGLPVVALLGARAFLTAPYEETKPLLDEMLECIEIKVPATVRALIEDDIEEVSTLLLLRDEVLNLHLGFSLRGIVSSWIEASRITAEQAGRDTSMSREVLEQ